MLYETPPLDAADHRVLDGIDAMRAELQPLIRPTRTWVGSLRRELLARHVQGSIGIEGYRTTVADVEAMMTGAEPLATAKSDQREADGYRQALSWVLRLAEAEPFTYTDGLLNGLHFVMAGHHTRDAPGWWRTSGVWVRGEQPGAIAYQAPEAEQVPLLTKELIEWLNTGNLEAPALVRAAMAHFNLVKIHPWRDGNGRMARALHTLVLAREGLLAPEYSSIEEWLGHHSLRYYDALAAAGGSVWSPQRDVTVWLRFALAGHHQQLQLVRHRAEIQSRLWVALEEAVRRQGWHERYAYALFPAVKAEGEGGMVHRAAYQIDAQISGQVAQADLRTIVRAGWLAAHGAGRGRHYTVGDALPGEIRDLIQPTRLVDPYHPEQ